MNQIFTQHRSPQCHQCQSYTVTQEMIATMIPDVSNAMKTEDHLSEVCKKD